MSSVSAAQSSENGPTFASVAREHIQTPLGFQRMVVWPALRTFTWMEIAFGTLAESAKSLRKSFKHTNHLVYWIRHPGTLKSCYCSIIKLKNSFSSGSPLTIADRTTKAYMNSAFAIELFSQAAKILHQEEVISLTSFQLKVVGVIGVMESSAFFIAAMYGIKKQVCELKTATIGSPEFNLALIRIVANVCLAIIGIFGMVTFTTGIVISSLAWVSVASLMLIDRLAAHFYEKLYVETHKNSVAN